MKNHSGRRLFLRYATSKRNRIISLCILPLVLLLSFFGSGRTVFADSNLPTTALSVSYVYNGFSYIIEQPHIETVNYNVLNSNKDNWINAEDRGCLDVHVTVKDLFTISNTTGYNPNYRYIGYFQSFGNFTVTATKVASNCVIDGIVLLDRKVSIPCDFSLNHGTTSYSVYNNFSSLNINRNEAFYFTNINFIDPGYIFNNSEYTFRVFYHSSDQYGCSVNIGVNLGTTPTGQGGVSRFASDSNILYNTLLTDQSILSAINNGNTSVVSAINSASTQAHSDAATAQSQAADIIDDINYDHSGTSQSVSATQSAYDAAQGAADAAVDAAVHSYASDLSTVEAYDYSSFFTSQRNSAVFWRDVGEYILDSSNLGFVSGSVIIVTLIGLVIFMLRL